MSNGSPTAFLSWVILSSLFLAFLLYHLWSYDRLQCLRWNAGRQPGAFRRLMTYSYLSSTPLFILFSTGMTTLKFKEGFVVVLPQNEVVPKPPDLWPKNQQHVLLALFFVFSVAWALEHHPFRGSVYILSAPTLVHSHTELAFWLFLLDQGPEKRDWFTSWEYRLWSISPSNSTRRILSLVLNLLTGCAAVILAMPLTTMIARHNILTIDAWIFLVGTLSSSTTNVIFIYAEGAAPDVVVRLATFYELNLIRIVFRFLASTPLLILAVDGIRGAHRVNRSLFWSDILLMISAIGQVISSLITVMIFFPRSVTKENGYHPRVASNAAPIETQPDAFLSPELAQAPVHLRIHSPHLTSLPGTPKSVSREGTPSPPPPFLRHAYTRSSSDIPIELERPPASSRRTTLPEPVLHHFVHLIDIPPDGAP
ncbi:hypothetical protein EDB84DRAFT_1510453 [Lactarius hengduanensis]|nr:hypothetical protein EDB84DRAFT_1510453 [Lactarius hengduanensis]